MKNEYLMSSDDVLKHGQEFNDRNRKSSNLIVMKKNLLTSEKSPLSVPQRDDRRHKRASK